MAVDAVASVILQKLRDLLSEESFTHNKVLGNQLEEMQVALEEMRGFFIDAADKESSVESTSIKSWTHDYLRHLYSVENSIESFALRITRQRKRLGFLMNHALFLKKFIACKMLSRKLEKIQRKIEELKDRKPDVLVDATPRFIRSQQSELDYSFVQWLDGNVAHENHEGGEDDDNDDDDDRGKIVKEQEELDGGRLNSSVDRETDDLGSTKRDNVSASPASVKEGSARSLLHRRSLHLRSLGDASIIRERCEHSKLMYSYSYDEKVPSIVGYKGERREPLDRLMRDDYLGDRIVSVVGELGLGKTILARAAYGNRTVKNRFKDACAWVTILKESTTTDILLNLLNQVEKSREQNGTINENLLKERLKERLKCQRYLIVLDGVESSDQWEYLKGAFPDEQNGSKIIITTCDESVALQADPKNQPHRLKKLNDKESWTLFLKKVGLKEGPEGSLKERIIEVCGGLPLNIVLLGSLLSTKKDKGIEEWAHILRKQENWETSDILTLCYNDLDAHLKLCLLYMMLFPKEMDIPVRRLQRLWLAEGFVKRKDDQHTFQEDVVQNYFDNLVKRSLILVSKLRSDGSPRKCRLLGVLHDFLLAKAQDIRLFHVHRGLVCQEDGPLGKRRLVEYSDGKKCPLKPSEFQHLRSYISFNFQKKDTPAKDVGDLVSNMIGEGYGLLRVLDLESVYKPSLPENLGDLFHLRYLGLRWTFLDKLPKSVGELTYLETLDLKHTHINRIPPSIWRLKHLKHLNLNEIHLDKDMTLHLRSSLPKLLTLWGLSVDHESPVKNGLSKLTYLTELGISFHVNNCDDDDDDDGNTIEGSTVPQFAEDLVDWISKLTNLQSLRLRSKDDSGCPGNLSLKPFSGLTKLSHMNLFGKLQKLPDRDHFPPNVKVLTLSVSKLNEDPMPILGQLKSLTVLRLLANSYLGETIVCPSGTFEGLEVLKLWMLKDLKKWELEEGAMEKLKELNIRCCSKLESIPSRLLLQGTFKDLILTNMYQISKENIEKNHPNVFVTVKNYKFPPPPGEEVDDAPNGMAY
ncbi:Apoptotic ATPase [Handroanthus impetiginosus]|uniref:Apoptotic ATPase n=1 Tax=Handroanthus impetiginosus TaxID=429701 RepID=A0A2G9GIJ9_9LAMI|nr:Apoptotic ATPase [Handroanthus impetiginosus]